MTERETMTMTPAQTIRQLADGPHYLPDYGEVGQVVSEYRTLQTEAARNEFADALARDMYQIHLVADEDIGAASEAFKRYLDAVTA